MAPMQKVKRGRAYAEQADTLRGRGTREDFITIESSLTADRAEPLRMRASFMCASAGLDHLPRYKYIELTVRSAPLSMTTTGLFDPCNLPASAIPALIADACRTKCA
eukprot:5749513-Amphidinium_carterae.1